MKLEVSGLTKVYPDGTRALDGIDLSLESGAVGVVGPNGSGKTTLLRILSLLVQPTSGRVVIDGHDLADRDSQTAVRASLGYLPQEMGLPPRVAGRDYLSFLYRLQPGYPGRRAAERRLDEVLELVALARDGTNLIGTYSGGMKRRLGIAAAIVHRPRLLIVDEPTSALDPEERVRFRNLVADLGEHAAVLISTHLIADVEATCDRLFMIREGRVGFHGTPNEMMQRAGYTSGSDESLEDAYVRLTERVAR